MFIITQGLLSPSFLTAGFSPSSSLVIPHLYPFQFTDNIIKTVLEPLQTPTGIWADLSPTYYYWVNVKWWVDQKFIPPSLLPPPPNPADYPDLESARTFDYEPGQITRIGFPQGLPDAMTPFPLSQV